jgi:hypothetical protein
MTEARSPVVIGMSPIVEVPEQTRLAVDLAARAAMRRLVDLRLVFGLRDLPPWDRATRLLAVVVDKLTAANPALVVTTAIYPGSALDALVAAARTASMVVACAPGDPALLDDLVGRLSGGAAPIVLVPRGIEPMPEFDWSATQAEPVLAVTP